MAAMLIDLSDRPTAQEVGSKAARLGWLIEHGWPVPPGVVAPFWATERLDERPFLVRLRRCLDDVVDPATRYAVRSSANAEDHGGRSFAGQFASVLDVTGTHDVIGAMREVRDSVRTPAVGAYARRVGVAPEHLRMAVIVQEMVATRVSGVAFSRDPVTGAQRVVVEAVAGRGDRLVGRGATPQRWVATREGFVAEPSVPLLPPAVVARIVDTVGAVAQACGEAVDVEWVWDGTALQLVQWRPVGPAPAGRVWSAKMAKDMLPGLIPPLVWSVNVPVLTRVWVDLLDDALGPTGLDPAGLVRPFGFRAYFDMSAFGALFATLGMPSDALEQMRAGTGEQRLRPAPTAMLRRAPRLSRFARQLAGWDRQARLAVNRVEQRRGDEAAQSLAQLDDQELLDRVDRLRGLLAEIGRLNIVTPLLSDVWAASVRRVASRRGVDPGAVDPGQEDEQVRALDPVHALATLDPTDPRAWSGFLARFGHLSDSPNDCSRATWSEQPEAVRRLVTSRRARGSADPAAAHEKLLSATPAWQRPLVAWQWDRAAALRLAREHIGYTYARVYALLRPTFLEIGDRLAERGVLRDRDDVFLLTLVEVEQALAGRQPAAAALVAARRAEMAAAAQLSWPETIVGDDPVPILGRVGGRVLHGVPTSRGRHTGPARVVTALADAPELGPHDVVVLEAADVTWTPLLLQASAVVTETGGMLSHASIVARELGLPCVASVAGATRIPDGTPVCVDGGSGEVFLLDGGAP